MSSKKTDENIELIKKYRHNRFNPMSVIVYVVIVVGLCLLCGVKKIIGMINNIYNVTLGKLMVKTKDIFNDNGETAANITALRITKLRITKRKSTKTFLRKSFNYVLPAIALVLMARLVSDYNITRYAIEVSAGENVLGYVTDEQVYSNAEKLVKNRVVFVEGDEVDTPTPKFKVVRVSQEEIITERELSNKIASSIKEIVPAEGLFVEDVFVGATNEIGAVKDILNSRINEYKNMDGVTDVSFVNNVKVETGLYLQKHIVSIDEIDSVINKNAAQEEDTKEIQDNVTTRGVSNAHAQTDAQNLTPTVFAAMDNNTSLSTKTQIETQMENMRTQMTKTIDDIEDPFAVEYIIKEIKKEKIKFTTVKKENKNITAGKKSVEQKGENGILQVVSEIKMVDGKIIDDKVLDKQVLKEPVIEKVVIGTAEEEFIWPLVGGYVSSGFGYRWGTVHTAIDIAMRGGAYGKPVIASKSGTVTFSGYDGSYGNIVRIAHDNGEESWYAHNSTLLVGVGDKVAQGEVIAKVGQTGSATGPHVHFEIRKNGEVKDPAKHLSK